MPKTEETSTANTRMVKTQFNTQAVQGWQLVDKFNLNRLKIDSILLNSVFDYFCKIRRLLANLEVSCFLMLLIIVIVGAIIGYLYEINLEWNLF